MPIDIINLPEGFEATCLQVFRHQVRYNKVYRAFVEGLRVDVSEINSSVKIPFLPVEFFKSDLIISEGLTPEITFLSSGTKGLQSKHPVSDLSIYKESFQECFRRFYGPEKGYCMLALLPSYLEREGSSLVYMLDTLIKESHHPLSGFYLHNRADLYEVIQKLEADSQRSILIGVTYALLDFAEEFPMKMKHTLVMETGGMKGQRKEMVREELHAYLCSRLGLAVIHSEYGMTELLSQAYSQGDGRFRCPPWMKVLIRDPNDPLSPGREGKTGGINIIDLANINSCSFIATQDLGKINPDGTFEVLGRFDNSDLRGCNLLIS
ncbi:MAG: acyl transferase [Bacteroidia bacterium]